ncbi:MAG: hypothetical protein WA191_14415 [Telluria sp.]
MHRIAWAALASPAGFGTTLANFGSPDALRASKRFNPRLLQVDRTSQVAGGDLPGQGQNNARRPMQAQGFAANGTSPANTCSMLARDLVSTSILTFDNRAQPFREFVFADIDFAIQDLVAPQRSTPAATESFPACFASSRGTGCKEQLMKSAFDLAQCLVGVAFCNPRDNGRDESES